MPNFTAQKRRPTRILKLSKIIRRSVGNDKMVSEFGNVFFLCFHSFTHMLPVLYYFALQKLFCIYVCFLCF